MEKKLLILDLDETLIYGTEEPLNRASDFVVVPYSIYKRPYLEEFITYCLANFRVTVWSSSDLEYAAEVANRIFPDPGRLEFVWARDRCTRGYDNETGEMYWIKDLKKVKRQGYFLEEVLVVDDSPEKHQRNYGNLIRVKSFEGDPDDSELRLLMRYLDEIKDVPNVRAVEKRNWRNEVPTSKRVGTTSLNNR